ncbi:hypothetical protein VNO77_31332 [Canavalia gladiata]|uniref:Uncharacterized protein n=1 Tax=Canavalia gladiata TaxID=3824 RepID=A0AAN9KSE0_CANGL
MGDLLGSPRVASPPFCVGRAFTFGGAHVHGFDCSNPLGFRFQGSRSTSTGRALVGTAAGSGQAFQRRLPGLEIHPGQKSSTGMGDLLGSPRVASPPFCVGRAFTFGGAHVHGFDCSNPLGFRFQGSRSTSTGRALVGTAAGSGQAFQRRLPGLEIHPGQKVKIV